MYGFYSAKKANSFDKGTLCSAPNFDNFQHHIYKNPSGKEIIVNIRVPCPTSSSSSSSSSRIPIIPSAYSNIWDDIVPVDEMSSYVCSFPNLKFAFFSKQAQDEIIQLIKCPSYTIPLYNHYYKVYCNDGENEITIITIKRRLTRLN